MSTNTKNLILEKSSKLFFNYGVQHITMDDIAKKCSISKKTIYKYFDNKSDLLHHIVKSQSEKLVFFLKKLNDKNLNALEELDEFFKYINTILNTISPVFRKELKKHHTTNFIEAYKFKNIIIIPFVIKNIEKGKKEGLYKNDLDAEETCQSFDNISKIIFTDVFFFNSEANEKAIGFLNTLFIHRLVSLKGLKFFNKVNDPNNLAF